VPGFDPEQQVKAVGERSNAHGLGVQAPAQRDDVPLDDGRRLSGDQGNPTQRGPHEVYVQAVRGPAGRSVDRFHARTMPSPLIHVSTGFDDLAGDAYLAVLRTERDTTEAMHGG
jgi:hypothetical protein